MAIVSSDYENQHTDPALRRPLRPRRAAVLACLHEAAGPTPVADVAQRTGLHINTARFHLDGLVEDGLAHRRAEQAETRGRPRVLYYPSYEDTGARSYRLMADMLMGIVANLDPDGSAAATTGQAWGRRLAAGQEPESEQSALVRLDAVLEGVGFAQARHEGPGGAEMRIHHCPFIELARQRPDVVCTLHLGLLRGAVEELDAPVDVTGIRPFTRPGLCVATLEDR